MFIKKKIVYFWVLNELFSYYKLNLGTRLGIYGTIISKHFIIHLSQLFIKTKSSSFDAVAGS
jgi:hypothetical protein